MAASNALKGMIYDNAAFVSRQAFASIMTAGSGGVSGKFIAHAALLLTALHSYTTIAGTSTYTATMTYNNYTLDGSGGTAGNRVFSGTSTTQTVHANTTQLNLIRITNTATFGAAPALSTSTIGPFLAAVPYTNGTATGGIGAYCMYALNTSTGTAGIGGLVVNHGDQFYVVNGTDATHVSLVEIEYQYAPIAAVMA